MELKDVFLRANPSLLILEEPGLAVGGALRLERIHDLATESRVQGPDVKQLKLNRWVWCVAAWQVKCCAGGVLWAPSFQGWAALLSLSAQLSHAQGFPGAGKHCSRAAAPSANDFVRAGTPVVLSVVQAVRGGICFAAC
jgi:hypothetical protein